MKLKPWHAMTALAAFFHLPPSALGLAPSSFHLSPSSFILFLFSHLSVAENDEFGRRHLFEARGTECVNLARADADLGAQAELAAIIEARRGVDDHGRRINPIAELARFFVTRRDTGLR